MNREILFKAKVKDSTEWIEGGLIVVKNTTRRFIVDINSKTALRGVVTHCSDKYDWRSTEVDPDTVCQYTGLTDKNGKKIWEGDIIKYHFGEIYAPVKFGEYQSCFDSTSTCHVGFYVDWDKNHNFRKDLGYWIKLVDAEVVGNIFDNPELLEEERLL